jgi:hypothetical protein
MKKILLAVVMVLAMAVPAISSTSFAYESTYKCTYCGTVIHIGGGGAPRDNGACMDNNWGPHNWVRVG